MLRKLQAESTHATASISVRAQAPRTRRKVRRRTALCIRYRCHDIQQYRFHLWSGSESSGLKVMKNFYSLPLNGYGPYTFFVGSIHNASYIAIERRVSDGYDFT
jgi:hypothetical protein